MTPTLVTTTPLAHLCWPGSGLPGQPAATRPVVLMLHGVGGGRQAWEVSGTGAALAEAGFTALAADFPGYGLSAPVQPYDLAGMAGAVIDTLAALGGAPAVLVGHSMGGMVAQEVVARAPQLVSGLVLAGSSPAFGKPGGDWQQAFLQSRFAPLDAGLGLAGLAAQLVPAMVAPGAAPAAIAAAQAMMAGVPEATYRAAVAALVAFDRRANLPHITVPTLVITGECDRTAAPEVARKMAERIPGALCHILPGAGHLLNIEQPAAFNTVLLQFLQQC
ncbi:MAG: alpha/beta hydrolase [Pseudomonadota bacterium]